MSSAAAPSAAGGAALRAALVTPRYAPSIGGVEAHVGAIASGLASQGLDITVLTQSRRTYARRDGEIDVRGFRELVPSDAYPVAPGVLRWLRRHADEVDVVHAHSYHGVPALAAALGTTGPLVFTPHYHGDGHTAFARAVHRGYRVLGRRIFDRADRIVCVSRAEADLVVAHHPRVQDRIDVIANGVDVDAIDAATPFDVERPVVLVLGRLVGYKRVDAVIRAMHRGYRVLGRLVGYKRVDAVIRAMRPLAADAQLIVVGDGPERDALGALARELGVPCRILGALDTADVHRWLQTAAVVVSASEHEAFGLTVLEGLTAGARVVASALPAHREVAGSWGGNGAVALVADPTVVGELSEAIRFQLDAGRLDRSQRARWSWLQVAARTNDVYRRSLGLVAC